MSEAVIGYFSKRYVVSHGISRSPMVGRVLTEWEFNKAFDLLEDAESYAERISEDVEHVRVTDRGEVES